MDNKNWEDIGGKFEREGLWSYIKNHVKDFFGLFDLMLLIDLEEYAFCDLHYYQDLEEEEEDLMILKYISMFGMDSNRLLVVKPDKGWGETEIRVWKRQKAEKIYRKKLMDYRNKGRESISKK